MAVTSGDLDYLREKLDALREKIAEQSDEIVILTRLLAQPREEPADKSTEAWLRQVLPILHRPSPRLNAIGTGKMREQQILGALKAGKLFDGEAYLRANPDVAAENADPLQHYLGHGLWEGRSLGLD